MTPLDVQLVAADRMVWEGEANGVSARTTEGELGILPGHAPLLSVLIEGEVRIDPTDGQRKVATIDGGFVSVDHDKVTVVAESVDASGF